MGNSALGLEITELRLGLPGDDGVVHVAEKAAKKRVFLEISGEPDDENSTSNDGNVHAKNRVVGWPPVCSYRQKNSCVQEKKKNGEEATAAAKTYVKVSLDGAPFLRKVGLNGYKGYADLLLAIEKLFGCFKIGEFFKYFHRSFPSS
ncbi:Iaa19p [Asimina triloba]